MSEEFEFEASSLASLGLRDAEDYEIFQAARKAGAVVVSKDSDFVNLLDQHGPPRQVIWITCDNTSNTAIRAILSRELGAALDLLARGERMIEIRR